MDNEKELETKVEESETPETKEEIKIGEEKEVKTETVIKEKPAKTKKKKTRNMFLLLIDAIILIIVAYFVVGYFNFYKISKGEEPVMKAEVTSYEYGLGDVTVHDYKIYKIVKYEIPNKSLSYSMKLWFMDDVK